MKIISYVFISIYCLIKNWLGITPGFIKKKPFPVGLLIQTCLLALSIIIMIFLAILFLIIQTFLCGMDLWLMWKLGKNYGGRLKGQDPIFECTTEKVSASVLLILKRNDVDAIINKRLEELFKRIHNSSYKFSCTVEKCLGYPFYLKNQVSSKDCCVFTNINGKNYITRNELLDHVDKNNMNYVCNQKRLWYAEIFTQPVLWNNQSETKKHMAVMFVFRHCLADATSMLGLLKEFLVQEKAIPMTLHTKYTSSPKFAFDNAYIYRNLLTCGKDELAFDVPNKDRHVAFYIEDKTKYVPLVKKLKNELGVGFTEILMAGLTASLVKVLLKRDKTMTKYTTCLLMRSINEDLVKMINGTYNYKNLTNDISALLINTPVNTKKTSTTLDQLNTLGVEVLKAKYSADSLEIHAISSLCYILPAPVLTYFTNLMNITALITNVGAVNALALDDYEIDAVVAFNTFFHSTSFILHVITNLDRFQLALSVKDNIVDSREEAQEIIDNIFEYIDKLSEDLNIH
nr:uncharacterized protein LOC111420515 [Onthophagus taurus]